MCKETCYLEVCSKLGLDHVLVVQQAVVIKHGLKEVVLKTPGSHSVCRDRRESSLD